MDDGLVGIGDHARVEVLRDCVGRPSGYIDGKRLDRHPPVELSGKHPTELDNLLKPRRVVPIGALRGGRLELEALILTGDRYVRRHPLDDVADLAPRQPRVPREHHAEQHVVVRLGVIGEPGAHGVPEVLERGQDLLEDLNDLLAERPGLLVPLRVPLHVQAERLRGLLLVE